MRTLIEYQQIFFYIVFAFYPCNFLVYSTQPMYVDMWKRHGPLPVKPFMFTNMKLTIFFFVFELRIRIYKLHMLKTILHVDKKRNINQTMVWMELDNVTS